MIFQQLGRAANLVDTLSNGVQPSRCPVRVGLRVATGLA